MRSPNGIVLAAIAIVAIIVATMSTFVVDPTEQALILRFGQPLSGRAVHNGYLAQPKREHNGNSDRVHSAIVALTAMQIGDLKVQDDPCCSIAAPCCCELNPCFVS
jgi:hypothetical protein